LGEAPAKEAKEGMGGEWLRQEGQNPDLEAKGMASGLEGVEVVVGCSGTRSSAASGHGYLRKGAVADGSTNVLISQEEGGTG